MEHFWDFGFQLMKHATNTIHVEFLFFLSVVNRSVSDILPLIQWQHSSKNKQRQTHISSVSSTLFVFLHTFPQCTTKTCVQ